MHPYKALFAMGSQVRVVARRALEGFRREWKLHHPLQAEQLDCADAVALVSKVSYYHGGDALYELEGVTGTWHERCLRRP